MKIDSKRKIYIDYMRVFACLSVIMIHIFTTARTDFVNHTQFEDIISACISNLLHYAVPIFFMITGYLFLSKKNEFNLKDFFKKYVLKYIIAIFTFGFGYAIIEEIFKKNYTITMPLTALLNTLEGKTWAHMWYLYSLVGVMLFIPIVKVLLDKDKKYVDYILTLLLISSFLMPFLEYTFHFYLRFEFIVISPYLAYAIIGYYLGNTSENNNKLNWIGLILFSSLIILSQIISVIYKDTLWVRVSFLGHYNSFIILGLAICLFRLFKNINVENKIINFVSKETYAIYLIHMFWINLIYKFFKFSIYGDLFILKFITVYIAVFVLSLISSIILKRIPFIKKII